MSIACCYHFDTGDAVDVSLLGQLAHMADGYGEISTPEMLQDWLTAVIRRLESLPEEYKRHIPRHTYLIGDAHFRCHQDKLVDRAKNYQLELADSIKTIVDDDTIAGRSN